MPRKNNQIPGQLDLFPNNTGETPPKKNRVELQKKRTDTAIAFSAKSKPNDFPITENISEKKHGHPKKEYTKAQYQEAVKIVETRGKISAGMLINHFRISALVALQMLEEMQKEMLILSNGKISKKSGSSWDPPN